MRLSGRPESLPEASATSGPPSGPMTPLSSTCAPPVSRALTATSLRVAGAVPSPRTVTARREASSTKRGLVVASMKRTKPSSTASVATSTDGASR